MAGFENKPWSGKTSSYEEEGINDFRAPRGVAVIDMICLVWGRADERVWGSADFLEFGLLQSVNKFHSPSQYAPALDETSTSPFASRLAWLTFHSSFLSYCGTVILDNFTT